MMLPSINTKNLRLYEKKKNKISLFVNILMKNGKKTTALRLLEKSLYIFMHSIVKIKMQPLTPSCTKKKLSQNISTNNLQNTFSLGNPFINHNYKEIVQLNRPNTLFIRGLYNKKVPAFYPLCFTNPYIFVEKYQRNRLLQEQTLLKNNTSAFSAYKGKTLGFKNVFTEQFVLRLPSIKNIYPTHRPLCKKSISYFLEKQCMWSAKDNIFPFIGDFYGLFEKFYRFKAFNIYQYKTYKQKSFYVQMPIGYKKIKGSGIYQYPWYKCKYSTHLRYISAMSTPLLNKHQHPLPFTEKKNIALKNCFPFKPESLKEKYRHDGDEFLNFYSGNNKSLWYQNRDKMFISWEKLSFAQKNCLLFSLYKAISNVKPPLECRSKRFGGSNRQIPATVSEHRQYAYAIGWIIQAAQGESSIQTKKKVYTSLQELMGIFTSSITTRGQGITMETRSIPSMKSTKEDFKENNAPPILPENIAPYKTILPVGSTNKRVSFLKKPLDFCGKGKYISHQNKFGLSKGAKFSRKSCKIPPYFCFFLANALKEAYHKQGFAVEKRNLWVDTALANRAYLRFRWW